MWHWLWCWLRRKWWWRRWCGLWLRCRCDVGGQNIGDRSTDRICRRYLQLGFGRNWLRFGDLGDDTTFATGKAFVEAFHQDSVKVRGVRSRQENQSATSITCMQMSGDALFRSSGCQNRVTISEEVGANDGVPLQSRLLEIRSHLGSITLISGFDYASMRDSTHMADILLIGLGRIRCQALQPIVVIHRQSVALQKKRTAKEIHENAAVLKKLHKLEQSCLDIHC